MDELEKKEPDILDDDNNEVEDGQGENELVKELEEIRDMFQQAIDDAGNTESEKSEDESQEDTDTLEADSFEFSEVFLPICDCCGKRPVSTRYGKDYAYCDECRELMKRYPLRIGGVIAVFVMIAVFALSVFLGIDGIGKTTDVLTACEVSQRGKMLTTLDTLYTYISNDNQDSKKISKLIIDAFCRSGYLADAKDYIENNFTNDELKSPFNKKYKNILDEINNFMDTQEATQDIIYDAFSGNEFDYDPLIAELDALKEKYINEKKGTKYNPVLIEYYKAQLMQVEKKPLEDQLEALKGIEALDKDGFYLWLYGAPLCQAIAKTGDEAATTEYFEKLQKYNCENIDFYKAYASYYRFLDTPDADAMIKIAEEAAKHARSGDRSYDTIIAMAYLFKGEGSLAFDTMQAYMASSRYSVSDCNLFALCALYCGDTETYEDMKKTLENSGYKISPLVEDYKNKKITLEEALTDMGGDI